MIRLTGVFFDGKDSSGQEAQLTVFRDNRVELEYPGVKREVLFDDLNFSDRVGNILRNIYFPDDAKFETRDNDAVDKLLRSRGSGKAARTQHVLESRLKYIALAFTVVVTSTFVLVRYGIPAGARAAAFALPASTSARIGIGTLELMDKAVFEPSELPEERQRILRRRFADMLPKDEKDVNYRLKFRQGKGIGANAFALPSGIVVMTDELVALAEHDSEIVSVLAHEIGHIRNRHTLRRMIQDSVVTLLAVTITGDVSSASTLIVALPTILIEAQYSQVFEKESDTYALAYMLNNRVAPKHFVNIMNRMESSHRPRGKHGNDINDKNGNNDDGIPDFFSTHPPTRERIKVFNEAQRRFENR